MAPPAFASLPMHVDHIPGRPIVLGLDGYEFACPACAFDLGKASKEGKAEECYDIVYKGLHVENREVFEMPNIKPLPTPLTTYNAWVVVPGPSISIKSAPASGFNVVCPHCAFYLGNNNLIANYNSIAQGNHINHTQKVTPVKEEDATKEKDASTTSNNKDDETTKDNEGETEANKKRTTAVMGNEGVAGNLPNI